VDHRLIRDRHIELLSHEAAALYLFLVTVADCQGLSYYSDVSLCERLSMDAPALVSARICLAKAGLVAYKKPLYQVLALGGRTLDSGRRRVAGEPTSIAAIFKSIAGGVR
jgi:hypothetical protein